MFHLSNRQSFLHRFLQHFRDAISANMSKLDDQNTEVLLEDCCKRKKNISESTEEKIGASSIIKQFNTTSSDNKPQHISKK